MDLFTVMSHFSTTSKLHVTIISSSPDPNAHQEMDGWINLDNMVRKKIINAIIFDKYYDCNVIHNLCEHLFSLTKKIMTMF